MPNDHDPATPGRTVDRAGFQALVASFRASFPDLAFEVKDVVLEGDLAMTRWVATGTHTGAPLFGIAPGGARASLDGFTMSRFDGALIVEDVAVWDTLGLLRSLGAMGG